MAHFAACMNWPGQYGHPGEENTRGLRGSFNSDRMRREVSVRPDWRRDTRNIDSTSARPSSPNGAPVKRMR